MQTTAFRTRDGALRGLGRDPTSAVLLNAVASAAIALTRSPNLQKSLRQALEILGEATCVDRVNVFRYDHAEAAAYVFAEWAKPGVPPCSATSPGPFRHADYLEVFEPTMRGEAYHSNLAEKLGANLKLNELNGVCSDLLVPIFVQEEFWGLLNFDDCSRERTWGNGEIEMLRIAAEVIAAALRREALEQEKTEAVAREREQAAKERVAELKRANLALGRATAGLVGEVDVATFLCSLQAETTAFTGAKTSGIFTYDESTERLRMLALMTSGASVDLATDPRMEVWRNDVPLPITRRWVEQLRSRDFATFDNHTAPEAHPWPISRKWHEMMGHRYIITVPLYVGQRMIGTFGQCFPDGYDVTRFDFALTRVFANHAALALQLTQLAERARDSSTAAAVLDERARLAGQIHDTLAQQFTGALLHLEALSTRAARGYRVTAEDLQTVRKIAAFGLAEARRSALNLRPLELDTGTLADALQHLAERSRVAGLLECDFSHTGAVGRMKAADEEALLNIAHEAVNNAIRHADASRIRIQLNHSPGLVELVIADDGRGFDHSQTHQQGRTFGLRSMEARAAGMGARFEVISKPGHGTVVIVRVPMA